MIKFLQIKKAGENLNLGTVLEEVATKDLQNLERNLELAIGGDEFIKEVCAPLIRGGKRLRPMLFLLCSRSRGGLESERTIPLATALELIHTASLVHDDILDSAKNAMYGVQIAVLVGDYLFAKAFNLVAECGYGSEIEAALSELVKNLCVGEIMQDRTLYQVPDLGEYYNRINLKTAVFLSTCCKVGGLIANLETAEVESLAHYGSSLGLAFQIIDDVLDFFGDEKVTGKKLGGDIKSGVVSLPVIRALKVSDKSEVLREIVTHRNVTDDDITLAIEIVKDTDAVSYCKNRAEGHIDSARLNLPINLKPSVGLALEQIADFVVDRTW